MAMFRGDHEREGVKHRVVPGLDQQSVLPGREAGRVEVVHVAELDLAEHIARVRVALGLRGVRFQRLRTRPGSK